VGKNENFELKNAKQAQFPEVFMQNKANFKRAKMNVNIYRQENYENFHAFRPKKNKANSKPKAGLWPEIRSTKHEIRQLRWRGRMPVAPCRSGNELKGYDLKKQSQYAGLRPEILSTKL